MHYAAIGPHPDPKIELRRHIRREVVPRIDLKHWRDVDRPLPLRYRTDFWTVFCCTLPYVDGRRSHSRSVYVLECIDADDPRGVAQLRLGKTIPQSWPDQGWGANRRIYVGRSSAVVWRLYQHVNDDPEEGADFTQVFQPVRILDIEFYRHMSKCSRAEKMTADMIQEEFPDDFVYQA